MRGPLYLCSVSRTGEAISTLREELVYVHKQIVQILTSGCVYWPAAAAAGGGGGRGTSRAESAQGVSLL